MGTGPLDNALDMVDVIGFDPSRYREVILAVQGPRGRFPLGPLCVSAWSSAGAAGPGGHSTADTRPSCSPSRSACWIRSRC